MTTQTVDRDSIRAVLGVSAEFGVQVDTERRIAFLTEFLATSGASGYVLDGRADAVRHELDGDPASVNEQTIEAALTQLGQRFAGSQGDDRPEGSSTSAG